MICASFATSILFDFTKSPSSSVELTPNAVNILFFRCGCLCRNDVIGDITLCVADTLKVIVFGRFVSSKNPPLTVISPTGAGVNVYTPFDLYIAIFEFESITCASLIYPSTTVMSTLVFALGLLLFSSLL